MKKIWHNKIQTNAFVFWGLMFLSFVSLFLIYREVSRNAACIELLNHNTKNYKPIKSKIYLWNSDSITNKSLQLSSTNFIDIEHLKKREEDFNKYKKMDLNQKLSLDEKERDRFRRRELKRKLWGRTCPQIDYSYLQDELRRIELKNLIK